MEFSRHLIKMKNATFFCLFLIGVGRVQSDANLDHFVMNEAHIQENRAFEDANARYPPFYAECKDPPSRDGCVPAIPFSNENKGYVTIITSGTNRVFYGCLLEINRANLHFPQYFEQALILNRAPRRLFGDMRYLQAPSWFKPYVNIYKYSCKSEVSPTLWKQSNNDDGSYYIGFQVINHDDMPLASVSFDHGNTIPLCIKYTLYAASLTAPTASFSSPDEIVYAEDSTERMAHLQSAIQSYYDFNIVGSTVQKYYSNLLNVHGVKTIPTNVKLSLAHLIPEYDMPLNSWKKVARFAQTIVPIWTELYLGVWADVEEVIREYSFWNENDLTIYAGTHGRLVLNELLVPPAKSKFFLNGKDSVPVPQFVWKIVVNEKLNERGKKEAIVFILNNITDKLLELKIFNRLSEIPCSSKCKHFSWDNVDKPNIYCCTVNDVLDTIDEFPDIVRDYEFDVLNFKVEK